MKTIYSTILVASMIGFSGCDGASDENPTITLKGDTTITLAVGQLINEPGYSASDVKDGDLTNAVEVKSNLDYYKTGTYYVNYSVIDSDGNRATASRTIYVTENGANNGQYSGDYQYGDVGSIYYDFATYKYNYLVREEGKTVTQTLHEYDNNANPLVEVVFERNANDGSIYEYNDNKIATRDYIGIDQIQSVDDTSHIITMQRNIRTNEEYLNTTINGVTASCKLVEHLGTINTRSITHVDEMNFNYTDVLHTQCNGSNGNTLDAYYANGWGEVLSISNFNGIRKYSVLDKNSMQTN